MTTVHNTHAVMPIDVRLALDEVAQALSVIAPVTTRLRQKLGEFDEDAVTLEIAVGRAIQAIRRLQPREVGVVTPSLVG